MLATRGGASRVPGIVASVGANALYILFSFSNSHNAATVALYCNGESPMQIDAAVWLWHGEEICHKTKTNDKETERNTSCSPQGGSNSHLELRRLVCYPIAPCGLIDRLRQDSNLHSGYGGRDSNSLDDHRHHSLVLEYQWRESNPLGYCT